MSVSISFVIPTYNEEGCLNDVIEQSIEELEPLTDGDFEVIIIDDCSTDRSAEITQEWAQKDPRVRYIRNVTNIGCHPSSIVGFNAAEKDWILFLPADMQIKPNVVHAFAQGFEDYDVVHSWRKSRADNIFRHFVAGVYHLLLRLLLGVKLNDPDSSAAYRREALQAVLPRVSSHSTILTIEMMLLAERSGYRVGEVVIEHFPRTTGVAKGLRFRDVVLSCIDLVRLRIILGTS